MNQQHWWYWMILTDLPSNKGCKPGRPRQQSMSISKQNHMTVTWDILWIILIYEVFPKMGLPPNHPLEQDFPLQVVNFVGVPQNEWFVRDNPIQVDDDWGSPYDLGTPLFLWDMKNWKLSEAWMSMSSVSTSFHGCPTLLLSKPETWFHHHDHPFPTHTSLGCGRCANW